MNSQNMKWTKRLASSVHRFESLKQHKIILYLVLTVVAFLLAIWYFGGPEDLLSELMGNIFVGVIIAELVILLMRAIFAAIVDFSEDALKLTTDYSALMDKYKHGKELSDSYDRQPPLFTYQLDAHSLKPSIEKKARHFSDYWHNNKDDSESPENRFPIIVESSTIDSVLLGEVHDYPEKQYKLPEYLQINLDKILAAHASSSLYNNIVVRVDDFTVEDNQLHLATSRSTYFASMATNRAVDFSFNDGPTIRQLFDYDLHTPPLKDSRLSNHLGFNIVVITSDDYILFVERNKKMSIGKRSYGTGVGASLKTRYAILPDCNHVTLEGIERAVINETLDELLRPANSQESNQTATEAPISDFEFNLENNYVAFYRDLVEGGKPQLLFWIKLKHTLSELQAKAWRSDSKDKKDAALKKDGTNYVGIKVSDMDQAIILPDGIAAKVTYLAKGKVHVDSDSSCGHRTKDTFLPMVPSASASVAMYINYLKSQKILKK